MALNSNFRTLTADNIEGIVEDRNYLKSSFENGTITGWTEVAVALTSGLPAGTPTIGSSAASSLALSATSVTPLSGSRSLLVDVPSALTAGHGFISDEFTLDRMDLGKVLTVSFDYERVSGTYNFSGTLGSQTWMVYVYDATAGGATWIQPAGYLGMNQSSGPGRIRATFQSSVTAGQKYRVAVIASQAAAGASSIEFDNFTCSRQTAPIGPVVTDWQSYTPTGTWVSGATYTGKYRRVGDSIQCSVKIAITGAVTATDLQVSIPSGFSIDTAKMASGDFLQSIFGAAHGFRSSGGTHYNFQIGYASPTLLFFTYQSQLTSQVVSIGSATPFVWANGDAIHATFMVPVVGASCNVQLSNDTDTRVVAARMRLDTNQVVSGTSPVKVLLSSSTFDTHSGFQAASNRYIIPVSGFYKFYASAYGNPVSSGLVFQTYIRKNNVTFTQGFFTASSSSDAMSTCADISQCNAGDVIEFYVSSQDSSYTIQNNVDLTYLTIERLSGPSVVAASETVAARYFKTATQSFSAETKLTGYTRVFDTHGAWDSSNNLYRFPISGKYLIQIQNNSVPSTVAIGVACYKINNGTTIYIGNDSPTGSSATMQRFGGSSIVSVNAGDYIEIYHFTSAAVTVAPNEQNTHFTITRVGN